MTIHNRWLRTAVLILVVMIPTALGAYSLPRHARYPVTAAVLLHGPLVLVGLWSALSNTPIYLRWSCGGLALWALVRYSPEVWRRQLVWQIVPDALLTFTVLCLLRELGLRIRLPTDNTGRAADEFRWRFTLRRLLGWVAGAAVLTLAWKHTLAVLFPLASWKAAAHELMVTFSLTAIDLLVLWALLRPGRVRWRLVSLLVAALLQTLVRRYAEEAMIGIRLSNVLLLVCVYDLFYLGPMLLALALVRSGGYRWTASQSLSP